MKLSNTSGFTIIEVLTLIVIELIALMASAALVNMMMNAQVELTSSQGASSHELEARALMRRENASNTNTLCYDELNTIVTANLSQIVNTAEHNSDIMIANSNAVNNFSINLQDSKGFIDFSNRNKTSDFQRYGTLHIIRTELTDFRINKKINGYALSTPQEFNIIPGSVSLKFPIMYIISANLKTTFVKKGNETLVATNPGTPTFTSNFRVNFAIRNIHRLGQYKHISCGTNSLAEITAPIEACKAFGEDYEFVYDQIATDPDRGQCYMPVYDPKKSNPTLGSNPDGKTLVAPTGYSPLKLFFCQGAYAKKSFNNPFCTGVN